jgi:RHS repeat-associated protein
MLDAKEQFSDTVSMSVEPTQNPNVYSVVITADSNWLNAPERLYPVTIDPTVKTLNATGTISSDTYVAEYSPYYYYNSTYMTTGWDSGFGRTRAFLKFNLPTLPSGAIVTDALLSLYKYTTTSANSEDLVAFRVIDSWNETNINWGNQPTVDSNNTQTQASLTSVAGSRTGYVNFNVWSIVKGWKNGGLPNNGFMVAHNSEGNPLFFYRTSEYGSNTPFLSITYITDPIGLNPYWSYANTSAGSVNTFNGNFLTTVADFSLPGRGIPISVTRTYNSRGSLDGLFGQKWFSNLDMQLKIFNWGVVLLDSTGTERPFMLKSDGQTYAAPDNYPMQLYKNPDNTFYVQEANPDGTFQTKLPYVTFDSTGGDTRKLKALNDGKENSTGVTFNTSNVIITDPSGRTATLTLNPEGKVSQITTSAETGKVKASYTYVNEYLEAVTYDNSPDDPTVRYGWTNGLLTSLTDKKGTPTYINYDSNTQVISTGSVNKVSNPSLESSYDTDLDHWLEYVDTKDAGSVQQYLEDPSLKKYGRYGLKITSVYKAGSTGSSYLYASQKIPVKPGTQYTYSSSIRTNALNGRAFLNIQQVRADDSSISWHDTRASALTGTTSWTKQNLTVTADSNAAYFIVYLEIDHDSTHFGGDAYFDGVQLETGPTVTDFQGHTVLRYGTDSGYDSAWVTTPTGEQIQYKNNNYANPVAIINDPKDGQPKSETQLTWDAQDRMRSLITPNLVGTGKKYSWEYDALGNPTKAQDPVPNRPATEMTYYYNRLAKLTQADGNKVENIWDPVNLNKNTSIDQTLNAKAYSYDTAGNPTVGSNLMGVADNRLLNSGFTRFDGNYQPYDWSPYSPAGTVNKVEYYNEPNYPLPFGGSNVLHINPGSNDYAYQWSDYINLNTGGSPDYFNISGYMRTAQSGSSNGARLNVYWYDSSYNQLRVDVLFNVRSQDWQRYFKTLQSPQNAVYAKVMTIVYGPYDGYFDDIQFEKSELPRGYNSIENSSFERGSVRWYASDANATVVNDVSGSYSGSYNARVNRSTTGKSYLENEYAIPANPDLDYTLTGFLKTTGVSTPLTGGAWIHIYFYDGSGYYLNDYATKAITGNTGWTKYVLPFKPPANTAIVKVRAELDNASGTANFDNIRLSTGRLSIDSSYDVDKNYVTSVMDQRGKSITIDPNAYGQTESITSPTGENTDYTYNGQGQLSTVTDNDNKTTTYVLDANGNVTDVSTATTYNRSNFQYDVNANLTQEKDALNNLTTFAYDEGGRITKKTNPNSTSVSTVYDSYGNLNKVELSGGSTYEFGYDLEGQRTSSIVKNSGGQKTNEFTYAYDEVGNVLNLKEKDGAGNLIGEFTAPTGSTMHSHLNQLQGFDLKYGTYSVTYTFSYTKAGLIKDVSTDGKVFNFEYDESNNLISRTYANSTQDVYMYNEANQIVKTQTLDSGNQPKWSSKYIYNDDGRLTNITGTGPGSPTASYVYNNTTEKLNRLTQATINDGSGDQIFNYSYDTAGNILGMDTPNGHRDFLYDAANRISQINGSTTAVSYDSNGNSSNGNLTKVTLDGVTSQYIYDSANRLIEVQDGAGETIAAYTYDGDGKRLTKTAKNTSGQFETTTYHYIQGALQYETVSGDPANVIRANYIRSPEGQLLGVRLYKPTLQQYTYYYYHYNAHGDVVAVTDSNGDVYRQYVYDPYGNLIKMADGTGNPVKDKNGVDITTNLQDDPEFNHAYTYRGYRYDAETGLYFLNARYYHAGIGRFLTKDSVLGDQSNPQTLNRYAYCGGDPVNNVDPNGHNFFKWLGGLVSNGLNTAVNAVLDFCYGDPTPIAYDYGSDGSDIQAGLVAADSSHSSVVSNDTPPPSSAGYKAPKTKGSVEPTKAPNGQIGWPDKSGNVWVPVPAGHPNAHGGEHWDVQYPNGGYDNVYPDGFVRKGKGPRGKFSPSGARFSELTGGALAVYWIVSEGTRIIPARWIVPIP